MSPDRFDGRFDGRPGDRGDGRLDLETMKSAKDEDRMVSAAADFRYLLGRGYHRPGALTFVGNHYQLPREQREILNRGVFPTGEAGARLQKLRSVAGIRGRSLGVDGHNVLITLESAILGRRLVGADDGVIRDTAGLHASYRPSETTLEALELLLDYIVVQGVGSVVFFLDAPMSRSGELAAQVNAALAGRGLMGRAHAVPVPEMELMGFPGPVATSDSVLIDRVPEPVDLAGRIIREKMPEVIPISLRNPGIENRTGSLNS